MASERLYIVAYDIGDQKRWRRVFKLMKGYGHWLQLSVFQCRLTARRHADLAAALEGLIEREDDHVLIVDIGDADRVDLQIESLGKTFEAVQRKAIIV